MPSYKSRQNTTEEGGGDKDCRRKREKWGEMVEENRGDPQWWKAKAHPASEFEDFFHSLLLLLLLFDSSFSSYTHSPFLKHPSLCERIILLLSLQFGTVLPRFCLFFLGSKEESLQIYQQLRGSHAGHTSSRSVPERDVLSAVVAGHGLPVALMHRAAAVCDNSSVLLLSTNDPFWAPAITFIPVNSERYIPDTTKSSYEDRKHFTSLSKTWPTALWGAQDQTAFQN
ncbi:hypothetical protein INR49_011481 [Caranx melampygus]|nr:hypothetical protein INR49_011481 [Caranx melampygus]